jgi:hypothetical protein
MMRIDWAEEVCLCLPVAPLTSRWIFLQSEPRSTRTMTTKFLWTIDLGRLDAIRETVSYSIFGCSILVSFDFELFSLLETLLVSFVID